MSEMRYHVIETLHDDFLGPYLDRFQDDFPTNEQVHLSNFISILRQKEQGLASNSTLLCVLQRENNKEKLVGMSWFAIQKDQPVAFLWYLSVDPGKRSQGIGSQFYQEILRRARAQRPDLRFLLYEVERPDQTHKPEETALAHRRIGFYRRNGGQVCTNIVYWQQVRREPRVMMYLMVHALSHSDRESEIVLDVVRNAFEDSIEPVETLILE